MPVMVSVSKFTHVNLVKLTTRHNNSLNSPFKISSVSGSKGELH